MDCSVADVVGLGQVPALTRGIFALRPCGSLSSHRSAEIGLGSCRGADSTFQPILMYSSTNRIVETGKNIKDFLFHVDQEKRKAEQTQDPSLCGVNLPSGAAHPHGWIKAKAFRLCPLRLWSLVQGTRFDYKHS